MVNFQSNVKKFNYFVDIYMAVALRKANEELG